MKIKTFLNKFSYITKVKNPYDKYKVAENPLEADKKSLASDWEAVGNDMKKVIYGEKRK